MKQGRTTEKKPRRRRADPPVPYPRPPSPEALAKALRRKPAKALRRKPAKRSA